MNIYKYIKKQQMPNPKCRLPAIVCIYHIVVRGISDVSHLEYALSQMAVNIVIKRCYINDVRHYIARLGSSKHITSTDVRNVIITHTSNCTYFVLPINIANKQLCFSTFFDQFVGQGECVFRMPNYIMYIDDYNLEYEKSIYV